MQSLAVAARRPGSATAVASTAIPSTAVAIASTRRTTAETTAIAARSAATTGRTHHRRRFGQTRHPGRIHYNLALAARAQTLAAQFGLVAQGQMDDTALAAVHGIEAEWLAGTFYFIRGGHGAHAQFFDAQQAIVVGVERNPRMVFRRHPQRFHGEVFESQQ